MQPGKTRFTELDGLKFVALLWIMLSHMAMFLNVPWGDFLKASVVLAGASGKWGVTVLAVLSGYVCAASVSGRQTFRFGAFVVNRYLRFFLPLLCTYLLMWVSAAIVNGSGMHRLDTVEALGYADWFSRMSGYTVRYAVRDAILLNDNFGCAWWVREFFFGSVLVAALMPLTAVKRGQLAWFAAVCALLFATFQVWWLAIVLGALLYLMTERGVRWIRLEGKWKWLLPLYLAGAIFLKPAGEESYMVYCMDVLSAACLLLFVLNAAPVKRFLSLPVFARPGRANYSIYLLSMPFQFCCTIYAAGALSDAGLLTVPAWLALSAADIVCTILLGWGLYRISERGLYRRLRVTPEMLRMQ